MQVNLLISELRRNFLGHRDSWIKKVEMHVFEGENTFSWIAKVERFFRIEAYSEEEKLELVSISLEGEALGCIMLRFIDLTLSVGSNLRQN